MKFKKLKITKEQVELYFPVIVRPLLQREDAHVFAMLDDKTIYALAIVTVVKEQPGTYCIQYLYCKSGEREALRSLLLHIAKICQKIGIRILACRLMDEEEKVLEYSELLLNLGYINIDVGRSYLYYLEGLRDTLLYDHREKLDSLTKNIRSYKQINRRERIQFYLQMRKARHANLNKTPDPEIGLFYFENHQIVGFADMRQMGEDVLYIEDTYLWESKNPAYVRTALLLYGIDKASETMPEDTVFCYRTFSSSINEMYVNLFGEAEKAENILEFVKVI